MKPDFVQHKYYVYIMASKRNGTLYVGVTNKIGRRAFQHKTNQNQKKFTARYNIRTLVYIEIYDYIESAIAREKQLKSWPRKNKIKLIESTNPNWDDIFDYLMC